MSSNSDKKINDNRISSPEELNDYLKVTNLRIWMLLIAVVMLVGGLLLWSYFTTIESYAVGSALATGGELIVKFDNPESASKVKPGMEMQVGEVNTEILAIGVDEDGCIVASAHANIPDGAYAARVGYKATQVISMLLN